ncbi:MAG: alpha/beta hydrolase [Clostridia bacterium]
MKFKLFLIKASSAILTFLSRMVYAFNRQIPGIKTLVGIRYKKSKSNKNTLNIYYKPEIKQRKETNKKLLPIIVYFHGGGWACYDKSLYNSLCRRLADLGYVVFNADYRLIPKYRLEDIMQDAKDAIYYAKDNAYKYGGDGNRVILMGDSAGAHISSMVSVLACNGNEEFKPLKESIKALGLFYGAYDLNTMIYTEFPHIDVYMNAISSINDENRHKYFYDFSPVNFITEDFPPSFIASGEIDKLHESQTLVFERELTAKKVKHTNVFFDKTELRAVHAFMTFDGLGTELEVINELTKFLKEQDL